MIVGLLLAVVVGITLGLIGSGGSILTVPILVYIMKVDPVLATTYSLFAIGVTSLVGAVKGIADRDVAYGKIMSFGLPSMVTVFLTRTFLLPLVPDVIYLGPWAFAQEWLLMIFFALVMLASAYRMLNDAGSEAQQLSAAAVQAPLLQVVAQGVFVGVVTGIVGAGGGFLIIPALVNFFKIPLRRAVNTSLVLITINSALGFIGDLEKINLFDWPLLLGYTLCAMVGISIGFVLTKRIDGQKLKRIFAFTIVLISIFILAKELFL